ncbi:MAG: Yip1 family protein [Ignavibacteria bacterium]
MTENLQNTEENKDQDSQQDPEVQSEPAATEPISLTDALSGVFTEPGETFTSVKSSPKKNYWLIPILILILVAIVTRYLVTNDEEIYSEIKTKQTESVKKRLDEAVKDGKMSQEDANTRMEQMDKQFSKSGPFFWISIIVGPILFIFIFLFVKGLIFWGGLKIFKSPVAYMQVIAVLGLASIIESIQAIIDTVLAIMTGRITANIGPILIFAKDSLSDKMSILLGHFDIINIWYFIVIGIGFAAVGSLKSKQTIPLVFALWLIWVCLTSLLNLPFFG